MKLGIVFCFLTFVSIGMECKDLRTKEIYTYLVSDSNILFENTSFQNISSREVEAYPRNWMKIPNAVWIWRLHLASVWANFKKNFTVPGKIISGTFDFLVDQTLNNLTINGLSAQIIKNSGYTTVNQIIVTNLLKTGENYLDLFARAENLQFTGGITFVLRIVSQVLV